MKHFGVLLGFLSFKGGCGKTSLGIVWARILSALGWKVLYVDADMQNSSTFHFLPTSEEVDHKHLANALHDGDLKANIIRIDELDIIPSSIKLLALRLLPIQTLKTIIGQVKDDYDFIIFDTAPTLDNIVLNVANVVDHMITPVFPATFDWKTATFFKEQLPMELGADILKKWHVLKNCWTDTRSNSPDTMAAQYDQLFQDTHQEYLMKTRFMKDGFIRRVVDFYESVVRKNKKNTRTIETVIAAMQEITGIDITARKVA